MVSGARAARRAASGARLGARRGARRGAARRGEALWPPWAGKFSTGSWFLVPCRRPGRQILRLSCTLGALGRQVLDWLMVSGALSAAWPPNFATVLHSGRPGPPSSRLAHGFWCLVGGLAAKFCDCLALWAPWAAKLARKAGRQVGEKSWPWAAKLAAKLGDKKEKQRSTTSSRRVVGE